MRDYRTQRPGSYQEMTSGFRWEVPASARILTTEDVGVTPG